MDPTFIESRKEGIEKYLKTILKNRINYKECLYEFLEYDIARKSHSSKSSTPRQSFYGRNLSSFNKPPENWIKVGRKKFFFFILNYFFFVAHY